MKKQTSGLQKYIRLILGYLLIAIGGGILAYIPYFFSMNTTTPNSSDMKAQFLMKHLTGSTAYFAGGCFWCMEGIFEAQKGVAEAISGYAGGTEADATYEKVSAGTTDHREAVAVIYDPKNISYETLVRLYFTQIDPTQTDGQFADRGYRYTTAILYSSLEEKMIAEKVKKEIGDSGKFDKPIAVKIEPFTTFFPAEEYHQDYYKKSSFRYGLYKKGSGREGFIEENWEKDIEKIETSNKQDLKSKLSDIQYAVTQEDATERPFQNAYWDNRRDGIYVDVVDGSPLFASIDKFDSGTGWPSFTRVMTGASVTEKTDYKLAMARTEVRSKNANSHLGHVFNDGPQDKGGMRYCINSAALRFVPKEDMEKEGYGEYMNIFNR